MGKDKTFDWRMVQDKAQNVLGDDFWTEINKVFPKYGPNIDTYKAGDSFFVAIEAPGLESAEGISIKMKGNKLVIDGKIPWLYPVNEKEMLQKERFTGDFRREIGLPSDIDSKGKIDARYRNGIIEIRIPLIAEADEREITIGFEE